MPHSEGDKPMDGGPAYPCLQWGGNDGGSIHPTSNGMTLRDWFAGMALPMTMDNTSGRANDISKRAYQIADALLAHRQRTGGQE